MSYPQSVRKQGEESERIQQQLLGVPQEEKAEAGADKPDPSSSNEHDPRQEDATYWKHRFSVMQGKYNAEVPRLKRQIEQLEQSVQSLKESPLSQSQAKPSPTEPLLTEEEREEYGEFAELIDKVAGRISERQPATVPHSETEQLKSELESLKSRTEQNDISDFFKDVERAIPNWESVNNDTQFHQWLQAIEPYTGRTRQALLEEAQHNLDSVRAISFFENFLSSQSSTPMSPSRENLLQPQRLANGQSKGQEPVIWTSETINQFYSDVRRGQYQGREDEQRKIEQDIHLAYTQGRIR
ncbi:hypothetical protein [Pleionea sp. CnH1-48]|uniref:hypothetical protein n=1 Tax=Pleionea sp. CnH1-48 TaxID=2954494 RepID=UPI002096E4CD|nr:hypothetical protein [Pleionea sp. CnH1-48]MCO7225924.1 hypothetical protein [Pleionea sp. CnH1-48]